MFGASYVLLKYFDSKRVVFAYVLGSCSGEIFSKLRISSVSSDGLHHLSKEESHYHELILPVYVLSRPLKTNTSSLTSVHLYHQKKLYRRYSSKRFP